MDHRKRAATTNDKGPRQKMQIIMSGTGNSSSNNSNKKGANAPPPSSTSWKSDDDDQDDDDHDDDEDAVDTTDDDESSFRGRPRPRPNNDNHRSHRHASKNKHKSVTGGTRGGSSAAAATAAAAPTPSGPWKPFNTNTNEESSASWNHHYVRLQAFHTKYGHSGVPVSWVSDPDLGDWACHQRQLFREIKTGYRIASKLEDARWRQLEALRFPLDYESFHWTKRYTELTAALKGDEYRRTAEKDYNHHHHKKIQTKLTPVLQTWLQNEQNKGTSLWSISDREHPNNLDAKRMEKLEHLGVTFDAGGDDSD